MTYDNNGNVVYINQDHQSYDWRDRMTYSAVAGSADHTEYLYDHANQRVKKHTVVYVPAGGGADCETHPDQCPDPIYGIPRELPPVVTPPPGKLPKPIEVLLPTPDGEGQVLSSSARQDNNQEAGASDSVLGRAELDGAGAEITAQTVETDSTSTAPILTVEPAEPLPIGSFELPTTTPETVATTTDEVVLPEPVLIEPLPSTEDVVTTTALTIEPGILPNTAPTASDHVTYYIDKYYEKEWNGIARNHYFLGNINLAVEPLSGPNSGIYYVLTDHLGSSSLTTNSYGNMIDRTEYTPYGAIVATASTQDIGNKYKFTGKELDGETNLSYFGARYYNQAVGRFMAVDPVSLDQVQLRKILSDPQSLNGYTYARNNPVILTDPDGNFWHIIAGAAVGAAITGGITYWQTGDIHQSLNAAAGGAIAGAAFAAVGPSGLAAVVSTGALSSVAGNSATRLLDGGSVTLDTIAIDSTTGAVGGALGYGIAKGASALVSSLSRQASQEASTKVANVISDDALVVRGGNLANQTPIKFNIGPSRTPGVAGFSAQCNGTCTNINQLDELGRFLSNKELTVTTAGTVRKAGGDVIPTPGRGYHVTVTGLTGEQASPLFNNVCKNPNPYVRK